MKKTILIIPILLFSSVIYAQYQKTLIENCTWYEYYYFESAWNEQYKVVGDTIFNGTAYSVVSEIRDNNPIYNYYFREDTLSRKIYQYYRGDNKEILSYDYGLNVGDTFWMPTQYWGYEFLIVDSIKYKLTAYLTTINKHIEMEMPNNRVFYLSDPEYHVEYTWIEGIGSIKGLCNEWGYDDHNVLCHFDSLGVMDLHLNIDTSCFGPEYIDINSEDKLDCLIFPNPVSKLLNIKTELFESIDIINNFGQIVLQTKDSEIDISFLPKGIYFVRIKKANQIQVEKIIVQ